MRVSKEKKAELVKAVCDECAEGTVCLETNCEFFKIRPDSVKPNSFYIKKDN
jgi:hypothetical protein